MEEDQAKPLAIGHKEVCFRRGPPSSTEYAGHEAQAPKTIGADHAAKSRRKGARPLLSGLQFIEMWESARL